MKDSGLNADLINESALKYPIYSKPLIEKIEYYDNTTLKLFYKTCDDYELFYTKEINNLISKIKDILSFEYYDEGLLGNNYIGCLFVNYINNETKFKKYLNKIKNLIQREFIKL